MNLNEKLVILQFENNKMKVKLRILWCLMLIVSFQDVCAEESANARQARRIFNSAYAQVFGEQGASLHYDVNITGIYKTDGTIWYKGKKSKFEDAKMNSWNDGTTVHIVKKKKRDKEVEVYSASNNKSDKYSRKFKFDPDNFEYSVSEDPQGLMLTLKAKKGVKGIKEAHVLLTRKTYYPISLRIKISFIWTTIKISDFQYGGITDEMLRFPREKYKDYKFVNKK